MSSEPRIWDACPKSLLLPLLARPHRHAPILQTKPVHTSTLSAHESELAPRAVKHQSLEQDVIGEHGRDCCSSYKTKINWNFGHFVNGGTPIPQVSTVILLISTLLAIRSARNAPQGGADPFSSPPLRDGPHRHPSHPPRKCPLTCYRAEVCHLPLEGSPPPKPHHRPPSKSLT